MNQKIKKILKEIGLNDNEAAIYSASLGMGKTNISQLSKKAGIKRTTAYPAIKSLVFKGFLVAHGHKKRTLYEANNPKIILNKLDEKRQRFAQIFSKSDLNKVKNYKPDIEIHEGFEGMKKIYKEILVTSYKTEVLVYGTIEANANIDEHEKLYKMWMRMIEKPGVKMREILQQNRQTFNYVKAVNKINNSKHKVRVIPKNFQYLPYKMKMLEGDNVIYKNKIAFFSSYENDMYVIVVIHKDIYKIYRNLFEMSWEVAEEIKF